MGETSCADGADCDGDAPCTQFEEPSSPGTCTSSHPHPYRKNGAAGDGCCSTSVSANTETSCADGADCDGDAPCTQFEEPSSPGTCTSSHPHPYQKNGAAGDGCCSTSVSANTETSCDDGADCDGDAPCTQ